MKSTVKLILGILGVFCLGIAIFSFAKFESKQESEELQELMKPFNHSADSSKEAITESSRK